MEVVYLLFSIISTFLKSLLLSLLLPFRLLFFRRRSAAADSVSLYEGTVWHERCRPVHHSLRYRVRYALVDLDDGACSSVSDHLSPDEARRIADTDGPVLLLTIPESVGYAQNPLSVYYCYDVEGSNQSLSKCIAEVTNTPWGERVIFSFDPKSDLAAKPLHVSPFMDMLGNWSIKANDPSDDLFVGISVQHPTLGNYFTATLKAKRVPSSTVYDHSLFFWLMPHKVAVWIYWHAIKLWWKNVAFIRHPRYTRPDYKEEAVNRDRKLRCCGFSGFDQTRVGDYSSTEGKHEARWLTWRDAKWPWS